MKKKKKKKKDSKVSNGSSKSDKPKDSGKSPHSSSATTGPEATVSTKNPLSDTSGVYTYVLLMALTALSIAIIVASVAFPETVRKIVKFIFHLDTTLMVN